MFATDVCFDPTSRAEGGVGTPELLLRGVLGLDLDRDLDCGGVEAAEEEAAAEVVEWEDEEWLLPRLW